MVDTKESSKPEGFEWAGRIGHMASCRVMQRPSKGGRGNMEYEGYRMCPDAT